jgi:hypothetical protein
MARVMVPGRYESSLDRAGLSLAMGAGLGGAFATLLVALGDPPSWFALPVGFVIGAIITMMAAVALGGPLWIVAHALGRRGPGTALWIGVFSGFALFLAGQTYGFGLFTMPPIDTRTLLFRWISAAATSLILSAVSGGIALAMWRVAYRRA